MAQVIAISQIVRSHKPGVAADKAKGIKALPPVMTTIEPGTMFVVEGEELAMLRRVRAVRDLEPSELRSARPAPFAAPVAAEKPVKAKAPKVAKVADDTDSAQSEDLV